MVGSMTAASKPEAAYIMAANGMSWQDAANALYWPPVTDAAAEREAWAWAVKNGRPWPPVKREGDWE